MQITEVPIDTLLAYAAGQPDEPQWTIGRLVEDLGVSKGGIEYARRKMSEQRLIMPRQGLWLTRKGAEECRRRGMAVSSAYTF